MSNPADHSFYYDEMTEYYDPPRTERRCMNCGDDHAETDEAFCGTCREMGCSASLQDGGSHG